MSDPLADPHLYLNRELSWLEFNFRVLHEALDERTPLLERLKFLSITSTNLDEFFMVRVAGLRRQMAANVTATTTDGLTPQEQLEAITSRVHDLLALKGAGFERLMPRLAERGVVIATLQDLSPIEWASVDAFFETRVFPVLTPLAVDPGHPFPYISNLSLSLAVVLRDPELGTDHFARVKVPKSLPRWVPVNGGYRFVALEEVIGANLGALFPGMEIAAWYMFRITRNSDIDLADVEEPEDLLATIEEQVFRRRFGEVVRLEVQEGMPAPLLAMLREELSDASLPPFATLADRDVYRLGPLPELGDLMDLATLDIPELRDPPHTPVTPLTFRGDGSAIFDAIRERDLLVHHPFDSFIATTEQFLEAAAADPNVLAIKLTLYRTSGDTAIVRALIEAAQRGKQVVVLVELKARFDEANNISWARALESAGVHVVYGLVSLKTHTKTALVVRREADVVRRYVHIGTGNYNTRTARLYTDVGLFSSSPSLGADLGDLFNYLTGFSRQRLYRKLLVAPGNMRERFLELIDREAENARAGRPARIIAKLNAIVDPETIRALYRASQAGVEIDLIVRGICGLRPGVPGISDHIRIISVIGRFLEHSRIWFFLNDGADELYIGSADWMQRNFDRRVEVVTPVEDKTLRARLYSLLLTYLQDNRQAWELRADGSYEQRSSTGQVERASQVAFMNDSWAHLPIDDGQIPRVQSGTPALPEPTVRREVRYSE